MILYFYSHNFYLISEIQNLNLLKKIFFNSGTILFFNISFFFPSNNVFSNSAALASVRVRHGTNRGRLDLDGSARRK